MKIFLVVALLLHGLAMFQHWSYLQHVVYPRFESRSRGFDRAVVVLSIGFIIWVLWLLLP